VQALLQEMVADGCETAVLEATSHALSADWDRLAGSSFRIAAFLNLGHEHLDYHGSFEAYRAAKARLFSMLPADGSGWAVVNADDPSHQAMIDAAPAGTSVLRYGFGADCAVRAVDLQLTPGGSRCRVHTPAGDVSLALPLPGRFNVVNALAALSVALCAGVTPQAAVTALQQVQAPRGRMVPIRAGQPFDVIVDYAHNPDSFEQLFNTVRPLTSGRMIAVFGSAGERDIAKRAIQGRQAAEQLPVQAWASRHHPAAGQVSGGTVVAGHHSAGLLHQHQALALFTMPCLIATKSLLKLKQGSFRSKAWQSALTAGLPISHNGWSQGHQQRDAGFLAKQIGPNLGKLATA
jgi:UDP-N-acetylmuramyl-tripeptide synthetase